MGGNVSLYNQSHAGPIDPTPTVGMVGIIDDAMHITTQAFKSAGDVIILAGPVLDVAATPSSQNVSAAPSPRGESGDEARHRPAVANRCIDIRLMAHAPLSSMNRAPRRCQLRSDAAETDLSFGTQTDGVS